MKGILHVFNRNSKLLAIIEKHEVNYEQKSSPAKERFQSRVAMVSKLGMVLCKLVLISILTHCEWIFKSLEKLISLDLFYRDNVC